MHGSERPTPPPAGRPGTRNIGPGSPVADLEWAVRTLGTGGTNPAVPDPFASGTADVPDIGPEFEAQYDSECGARNCLGDGTIWAGDHIRAIGGGKYAHSDCIEAED